MLQWMPWLIVAVFGAVLAYLIVNEVVQRRGMRSISEAADARVRARCDIITGPDGKEYATLKPEHRPTIVEEPRGE